MKRNKKINDRFTFHFHSLTEISRVYIEPDWSLTASIRKDFTIYPGLSGDDNANHKMLHIMKKKRF